MERTLLLIKPDAYVARMEILDFIRVNGFEVAERDDFTFTKALADAFYEEHIGQPFFQELLAFTTSGPVCAVVAVAENAVGAMRHLLGATDPMMARGGTIRQRWGHGMPSNAAHASATSVAAEREIQLLFGVERDAVIESIATVVNTPTREALDEAAAYADDEITPPAPRPRFGK